MWVKRNEKQVTHVIAEGTGGRHLLIAIAVHRHKRGLALALAFAFGRRLGLLGLGIRLQQTQSELASPGQIDQTN